jgi:hypothetical protein
MSKNTPQAAQALADATEKALRRAFELGHRHWRDSDSESFAANRRADVTRATFEQLVANTVLASQAEPPAAQKPLVQPLSDGRIWDAAWDAGLDEGGHVIDAAGFGRIIQRACAEAWGLRLNEEPKGDASLTNQGASND